MLATDNSTAAVLLSVLPAAGEGQLKRCSVTHLTQFSISALNVFVRTCGEQKRTGRKLDVNHRKLVRWSLNVLHRPGIDTARRRCVVFQKCRRSRSEQNTAVGPSHTCCCEYHVPCRNLLISSSVIESYPCGGHAAKQLQTQQLARASARSHRLMLGCDAAAPLGVILREIDEF